MTYLIRKETGNGLTELVKDNSFEGINHLSLSFLKLDVKQNYNESLQNKEVALIIQKGKCTVKAGNEIFENIGERNNVFEGKAYAVYIPGNNKFEITANSECEIVLCYAPWKSKGKITLIKPEENVVNLRGKDNWTREVRDIINSDIETEHLILGETFNPSGNWSSYPSHRHEVENLPDEVKLEEIYFYKFDKPTGFGFQRIYTDDRSIDESYSIEENDAMVIPRGYHPVVGAPGYQLYYLWVLAGEGRILKPKDDPQHSWILNE